jgi:hypothetical protein
MVFFSPMARRHCPLVAASLAAVLLWAVPAVAAPADSDFAHAPLAVEGHLSFGAPLGLFGFALDYGPVRWLAVNAGVGVSLYGNRQLGITPRLRFPGESRAFAAGVGVSTGTARYPRVGCFLWCRTESWEGVVWVNPEISYETRWREQGTAVRWLLGVQIPTKGGLHRCSGMSCGELREPPMVPYIGVALGWTIPPPD